jgi:hypothetical protein
MFYKHGGKIVRTSALLMLSLIHLSSSSAADLKSVSSKCGEFLSALWEKSQDKIYYGGLTRSPIFKAMKQSQVSTADARALKMWVQSSAGDQMREAGVFEAFGSEGKSLDLGDIFLGEKRFIARETYNRYLDDLLEKLPPGEIELLRFRHTHPPQLLNPGAGFSPGDLEEFSSLVENLKKNPLCRSLKSVEFEIVYSEKGTGRILRKFFSVSIN